MHRVIRGVAPCLFAGAAASVAAWSDRNNVASCSGNASTHPYPGTLSVLGQRSGYVCQADVGLRRQVRTISITERNSDSSSAMDRTELPRGLRQELEIDQLSWPVPPRRRPEEKDTLDKIIEFWIPGSTFVARELRQVERLQEKFERKTGRVLPFEDELVPMVQVSTLWYISRNHEQRVDDLCQLRLEAIRTRGEALQKEHAAKLALEQASTWDRWMMWLRDLQLPAVEDLVRMAMAVLPGSQTGDREKLKESLLREAESLQGVDIPPSVQLYDQLGFHTSYYGDASRMLQQLRQRDRVSGVAPEHRCVWIPSGAYRKAARLCTCQRTCVLDLSPLLSARQKRVTAETEFEQASDLHSVDAAGFVEILKWLVDQICFQEIGIECGATSSGSVFFSALTESASEIDGQVSQGIQRIHPPPQTVEGGQEGDQDTEPARDPMFPALDFPHLCFTFEGKDTIVLHSGGKQFYRGQSSLLSRLLVKMLSEHVGSLDSVVRSSTHSVTADVVGGDTAT